MNSRHLLDSMLLTRSSVRRGAIVAVHAILWSFALFIALTLRFDGAVPDAFMRGVSFAIPALVVSRVAAFAALRLFRGMWRYAGMPELKSLIYATSLGSLGFALVGLMLPIARMPRSLYFGEFFASIVLVGGLRFALRLLRERASGRVAHDAITTVIVGAGDVGESLLRDMQRSPVLKWNVVGFLDDDPYKQGATIRNIPVLGKADEQSLRRAKDLREVQLPQAWHRRQNLTELAGPNRRPEVWRLARRCD
jgi:FlaA1/EpsC-like NDP-sugar epimerase